MFIEIPANKASTAHRKPVFGVGVNDANYVIRTSIHGKLVTCPHYRVWGHMLERCYDPKCHANYPTYIDAVVCDEWLRFSAFKSWMINQDWKGMHLDKDIIKPGNKHYSPENCCFVSSALNSLLVGCGSTRGDLPQGVCFNKPAGKYMAQIRLYGKNHNLGYFDTPEKASLAYRFAKSAHIRKMACRQPDRRVATGLLQHANLIRTGE